MSQKLPSCVDIIGTPVLVAPDTKLTQAEVGRVLGVKNEVVWRLLKSDHIQTRHLYLNEDEGEEDDNDGSKQPSATERHETFLGGINDIGVRSVQQVLATHGIDPNQIDLFTSVTSTALPLPGVSAIIMREIKKIAETEENEDGQGQFRNDMQRMDIVGMGCNGGASGLRNLSTSLKSLADIRGRRAYGLLLCIEINSALYLSKDNVAAGIVNSLFGDGAVALLVKADPSNVSVEPAEHTTIDQSVPPSLSRTGNAGPGISIYDFESLTLTDCFDDMIYVVDPDAQLMHFRLSKRIPYLMGQSAHIPVRNLLARHNMESSDISQWIVHGGGAKVSEKFAESLGLDPNVELRHTVSVMRDYGNLSSGSFLASLSRLYKEDADGKADNRPILKTGDNIVLVAMGPGATIEASLGKFL